jgi:hypothetical protein
MYPYFRLLRVLSRARFAQRQGIDVQSVLNFRAWPGDIDVFPEMNNGRQLTVMDLARRRKWGFAVAGASVRFRKRIRPFTRFTLCTRLLGHDARWFYFLQEYRCRKEVCSSALIRAAVTSKTGIVPVDTVLEAMGVLDWDPELPGWVKAWIQADDLRP